MSQEPRPVSRDCIYPALVGCSTPVEAVLPQISSNMWWVQSTLNERTCVLQLIIYFSFLSMFILKLTTGLVVLGSLFEPETSKQSVTSVLSLPVKSRLCQFAPQRSPMSKRHLKSMNSRYARGERAEVDWDHTAQTNNVNLTQMYNDGFFFLFDILIILL